jgi:acyl-[acyl-carrier-protein]-phospholipid O-acyltransferase/long-chain-fatty-acid--[acyl-carrier-protein] ligase
MAAIHRFRQLTPDLWQSAVAISSTFTWQYILACLLLGGLGISAGLFNVPLESYMQDRSPPERRGSILAATNCMIFAGILLSALAYNVMRMQVGPEGSTHHLLTSKQVFLTAGLLTLPILFYVLWLLPQATIRFVVWLWTNTFYKMRVFGDENIPKHGPALLTVNHISWLDGFMVMLATPRPTRVIAHAVNAKYKWIAWLAKTMGVIIIDNKPSSIRAALSEARDALKNGELVVIFPEGGISRTGQVLAFRPGLMRIIKGTEAPVVPVYLDELWGSVFSFSKGKFFWKWPRRWPYPVNVFFGKPLHNVSEPHQVRRAVQELGATAVEHRKKQYELPCNLFLKVCKKRLFGRKLSDSTGRELTGGKLLAGTMIMRRLLNRKVLSKDEKYVGVLLPPSVPASVVNIALAMDHRVSVNLNYTVSSEVANHCCRDAGLKHVITSRKFMEKIELEITDAEVIYLEDIAGDVTAWDKAICAAAAYTMPKAVLSKRFGLDKIKGDDEITIIFTSGSTGMPKGVVLTHNNIAHNVVGVEQVVRLKRDDVMLGVLPFFHSFGYTVTLWGAAGIDIGCVYHFNPLDSKQIGKLAEKYGVSILLATPTFLRGYLRRCTKEQFARVDVAVVGAEKMPIDLADDFEAKYGFRPSEGYGTTELSPLVSVNVPKSRQSDDFQLQDKEGTVGRPFPAVTAKITDLDTGEELGVEKDGMLWIKGPNVMKGYLNKPDATKEVIQDGWYKTGDVAHIDEDGFIKITGRMSRFSKIGGEMVPHGRVEDAILGMLPPPEDPEDTSIQAAVTSVQCAKKGEKLIVLHKALRLTPEQICEQLRSGGLPNIFIPAVDCFYEIEAIPMLGSGKLDLKGLKQAAEEKSAVKS